MPREIFDTKFLERYADGERNFAGIDLIPSGYRPVGRNLMRINLDGVVLRDINLRGAYFFEVSMIGIDLTGADLGGIFLRDCDLSEAIIRNANLRAANVSGSCFAKAYLCGSNLRFVDASYSCFDEAYLPGFEKVNLTQTSFRGAHSQVANCSIRADGNLIWQTTAPSGEIIKGPEWGGRF